VTENPGEKDRHGRQGTAGHFVIYRARENTIIITEPVGVYQSRMSSVSPAARRTGQEAPPRWARPPAWRGRERRGARASRLPRPGVRPCLPARLRRTAATARARAEARRRPGRRSIFRTSDLLDQRRRELINAMQGLTRQSLVLLILFHFLSLLATNLGLIAVSKPGQIWRQAIQRHGTERFGQCKRLRSLVVLWIDR
jgi:hypothetical protein